MTERQPCVLGQKWSIYSCPRTFLSSSKRRPSVSSSKQNQVVTNYRLSQNVNGSPHPCRRLFPPSQDLPLLVLTACAALCLSGRGCPSLPVCSLPPVRRRNTLHRVAATAASLPKAFRTAALLSLFRLLAHGAESLDATNLRVVASVKRRSIIRVLSTEAKKSVRGAILESPFSVGNRCLVRKTRLGVKHM